MAEAAQIDQILILEDWASPLWRLNNIYTIVTDEGKEIPFKMNAEQMRLYENLWYWNLILKARQMGFTTFVDLLALDTALFTKNFSAGIVAQTEDDVGKIFRRKIREPFDRLPLALREKIGIVRSNESELVLGNGSSITVGMSMRGQALQFLHVSEFGKICNKAPERAREIVTGAFETVAVGQMCFVESTAEGASGYFYDYTMEALRRQQEKATLSKMDFRLHFFPWYEKKKNWLDPSTVVINDNHRTYFDRLKSKYGINLNAGQMAWYVNKEQRLKSDMRREHPSYAEEAFETAIEGAIFEEEMATLRKNGQITTVPWEPGAPVNTFWDLGINDQMCITFHQRIGKENHIIDYYQNQNKGFRFYKKILDEKPYTYGELYLPHDGKQKRLGEDVKTPEEVMEELGFRNITVNDRIMDLKIGIDMTKDFLLTCWIDREKCALLINALDAYQRERDEKMGQWRNKPLHNWASNPCDSLRTGAEGYQPRTTGTASKKSKTSNWRVL